VGDWLRGELGFDGVIVSDDLEMGAVSETCPIGEAAVRAAAADHDLLLVCHTAPAQLAAAAALVAAYRERRLSPDECEEAAARVRRLRLARSARREGGEPAAEPDGPPLARAIATRAVTDVGRAAPDLGRALNGRVLVVFPRFSDLAPRITIEPEVADERGWASGAFGAAGITPEVAVVGIEPSPAEIADAAARAAAADVTVLFLFDAHLYASDRALLEALQAGARRLAVVLLRDPYDAALLAPRVRGLTAYGFRKCQLDAVVARLTHP
jgi:beta-glucosidase-like glycosyl hydrolase